VDWYLEDALTASGRPTDVLVVEGLSPDATETMVCARTTRPAHMRGPSGTGRPASGPCAPTADARARVSLAGGGAAADAAHA
jgi:hypothetical protein